jgi:prepilin-type N-terminal cleavage/methylation domain-containing protein
VSGRGQAQAGYSLLELMVTLAVMSVAMLLASTLIVQAMRLMQTTTRAIEDPQMLTHAWLRRDIHRAASLVSWSFSWSSDPLVLRLPSGETVAYAVDEGQLTRSRYDSLGDQLEHRVLLPAVQLWQWRTLAGAVVETQTRLKLAEDPIHAAAFEEPGRQRRSRLATEHLRLALRGSQGGRAW